MKIEDVLSENLIKNHPTDMVSDAARSDLIRLISDEFVMVEVNGVQTVQAKDGTPVTEAIAKKILDPRFAHFVTPRNPGHVLLGLLAGTGEAQLEGIRPAYGSKPPLPGEAVGLTRHRTSY